jgi:hypothetical protein
MLTAYKYRHGYLLVNFVAFGGFACWSVRFQVCNHPAVVVPPLMPCRYIRNRRRALHFETISVIPILSFVFVVVVSIQALGRLLLSRCTRHWLLSFVGCMCSGRQVLRGMPDFGQEKGVDITHAGCQARAPRVGSLCLRSHLSRSARPGVFIVCSIVPQKVMPKMVSEGW